MDQKPISILQLCKKFPFPLVDGESIAVNSLSKGLAENGCSISLLAMNTSKQQVDVDHSAPGLRHYKLIQEAFVDNKVTFVGAFKNLFSDRSYHISRFVNENYRQKLVTLLQSTDFEFILLESIYLAPYVETIRTYSKAKLILRAHNVEYKIWERIAYETRDPIKRWYVKYLTAKLKKYELSMINHFDLIAAVSAQDLEIYRKEGDLKTKVMTSQIGLDMGKYVNDQHEMSKPLKLGFIGSLDWNPNINGINWFIEKAWPLIESSDMNVELGVAGRNPSKRMFELADRGIQIYGEVKSAIEFMKEQDIMIVPLFSGSGIRVKILEALALKKIVITTSIGLEGIDAKHEEEILIADTPEAFLTSLQKVYHQEFDLESMRQKAKAFVLANFTYVELSKQLKTKMLDLI